MDLHDGIAHFNAHEFWEAHESWEAIWLTAEGEEKRFVQGLIQLAAAYYHVRRGTFRGALRLFDAARRKLDTYEAGYLGVERSEAAAAAATHRTRLARGETIDASEFPKLSYNRSLSSTQRNRH